MDAYSYLKRCQAVAPVMVLHGKQPLLKQRVLEKLRSLVLGDNASEEHRVSGDHAVWSRVLDHLRTLSMWGDRRLVVIEHADNFVSKHRVQIEHYVSAPCDTAVLVLEVDTWPSNTRLAKAIANLQGEIDCQELKGSRLLQWLREAAREEYQVTLEPQAAEVLAELVGEQLGAAEQELAKLSAAVGRGGTITPDLVQQMVGDWQTHTTWNLLACIRAGDVAGAWQALRSLLQANEPPLKILGGISFVMRKYVHALELGRKLPLNSALEQAGVFKSEIPASVNYLQRIGRSHAARILDYLLEADQGLKGGSRLSEAMQLEWLIFKLAGVDIAPAKRPQPSPSSIDRHR